MIERRTTSLPQEAPEANGHANGNGSAPNGMYVTPRADAAPDSGNVREPAEREGRAHPLVSVVVPALNEEKLIERVLRCFPDELRREQGIEVIVSDGGSKDRTVEIAKRYADKVVSHLEPRRQTIAEGRNRGAEKATGDLLVFINADTVPEDPVAFVRGIVALAREGKEGSGGTAFACPVRIAPEERRFSDVLFHTFFNNYVRLLNLAGLGMGRGECQIVWRSDFERVKGYNDHMAAGEDFDLYRRLSQHGRVGERPGLRVYESPRRFRRFGYLRVLFEWTLNGLAVMVIGRSISKEWEEIR